MQQLYVEPKARRLVVLVPLDDSAGSDLGSDRLRFLEGQREEAGALAGAVAVVVVVAVVSAAW